MIAIISAGIEASKDVGKMLLQIFQTISLGKPSYVVYF
jgi:hypothetical protein